MRNVCKVKTAREAKVTTLKTLKSSIQFTINCYCSFNWELPNIKNTNKQ